MGRKYTYDEVKQYFENDGEELLSKEYINNRTKLDVKCKNGHIYHPIFKDRLRGHKCPACVGSEKYTYEYVKSYFEQFEYELLSNEYHNNQEKLLIKCPKGHIREMCFSSFKEGKRCKLCVNKNVKHDFEFVKSFIENEGYELLDDDYINQYVKLHLKCPKGHDIQINFKHFYARGIRCSKCSASSGEAKIMQILDENNIQYTPQHRFKDCKDKNPLPFDFYLPNYNMCIEFDGAQHFKAVEQFGGKEGLKDRQKKDNIKTEYCKNNNIKLLRISYKEFNRLDEIIHENIIDKN